MNETEKGFVITGLQLLKAKIEKRNRLRAKHIANPKYNDERLNAETLRKYKEQKDKVKNINVLIAEISIS